MQISYPKLRHAVISAALVSASALALIVVPSGPTVAAQAPTTCANVALVNGSFETPTLAANTWTNFDESVVPGWDTSATDNKLEFWRAPFQGVPVPAGSQFAEVNANQRSKLFQDFATTPGETIRWQLQHRGRTGVDVMEVRIGDVAAPILALQSTLSTGLTWLTYSGLYTVPVGQTTTRISFDSISSANGNPTYGNFVDDVSVTSGACVVTNKTVTDLTGGTETRLGDTLQYSIAATNQGASAATLSSVVDVLPAGVSLVPGSITVTNGAVTTGLSNATGDDAGEFDSGTNAVRVRVGTGATSAVGGTLAAGASVTVAFSVVVDSVTALPSVANTATVSYTDSLATLTKTSTTNTTTTTITPDAPAVSIVTSGTVTPAENQAAANVDNSIAWSYVVANTGNVPLTDVTVNDPEGGTITCVPSDLGVGESATCTGDATRTVTLADLGVGSVSNGATATATPPFGASPIDSLESIATITTVVAAPAVSIVTTGTVTPAENQAAANVGNTIAWSYLVTNNGNVPLTDVTVNDPEGGTITCVPTTLTVGESATCTGDATRTVTLADLGAGSVSNGATAGALPPFGAAAIESTESIASIATVAVAPAVSIVTSGSVTPSENQSAAALGNTIAWSYIVSNTGNVPLTDVTVNDPEGGTITCVPSDLAVGESATCTGTTTHTVTPGDVAAGSISNGAIARATPPFGAAPIESTESIATVTTAALAPSISVAVEHDNLTTPGSTEPAEAGDQIRARFVVTNTGNSILTHVHIIDPVFGDVTCADEALEPGESTTCEANELYTVTDDDATAGTITRTISAAGLAEVGVVSTSVTDERLVDLEVAFDLPTLPLPEDGDLDLAATGANVGGSLTLALVLLALGLSALVVTRVRAARREPLAAHGR